MMDFSETISVYGIKVDIHSKHVPEIKVQGHSYFINSKLLCPETNGQTQDNLHIESSWDKGPQIYQNWWGHITKMAAMLIYGKNL